MTTGPAKNPDRRIGAPRGFVMPFVILLALVVSLFALVMVNRESVQRRTTARLVRDYAAEHMGKGIREVVGGWIKSLTGQPIEKMTEGDGHALDLALPDGTTIAIYLSDGQGALMDSLGALNDIDAQWVQLMLDELALDPLAQEWQDRASAQGVMEDPLPPLTRQVGPAAVSLQSAPEPVLNAIARAISGEKKIGRFVEEILRAREDGEITEADINTAAATLDLSAEDRATLLQYVTLKPELWKIRAEVIPTPSASASGVRARRYEGRFKIPRHDGGVSAGAGKGMVGSISPMGPFLEWTEVQAN
jgi:hypothetical protein